MFNTYAKKSALDLCPFKCKPNFLTNCIHGLNLLYSIKPSSSSQSVRKIYIYFFVPPSKCNVELMCSIMAWTN